MHSLVVRTAGDYADGVHAVANAGASYVFSGYVKSTGTGSVGIYAYGDDRAVVQSGVVVTIGDFAQGIEAISPNGSALVVSTMVVTQGYAAIGIDAYGYTGATVKDGNLVETYGYKATGIKAYAFDGPVSVTSYDVVTKGDLARGISAVTSHGDVTVTSTGVWTYGYSADGIAAVTDNGGNVSVKSTFVYTEGDYSQGIHAHAHAAGGDVYVNSGEVTTEGFAADGVYAVANGGAANVHSNYVFTYGAFATGILTYGHNGARVYSNNETVTHGSEADAIDAEAGAGDVYVRNKGLVAAYGASANGIVAETIASGNVAVVNYGAVYSQSGAGIASFAEGGKSSIFNRDEVYGGAVGIYSYSAAGTYIGNNGTIKGGAGYAIGIAGAPALVLNNGDIFGYAIMTSSQNLVDNTTTGRWFAYGNSYFGTAQDVFDNAGLVKVAPFSVTPTTVTWSGLTVFNNSGLVDLRNGHTGDIFNLEGNGGAGTTWTGLTGSTLAVDATLSASLTSDRMNVGAVNGSTTLVVDDLTPMLPGTLNFVGTTVVHGTSGAASDFTWAGRTKGFINYELQFFSGPVDWNIVAPSLQRRLRAPEGAGDGPGLLASYG